MMLLRKSGYDLLKTNFTEKVLIIFREQGSLCPVCTLVCGQKKKFYILTIIEKHLMTWMDRQSRVRNTFDSVPHHNISFWNYYFVNCNYEIQIIYYHYQFIYDLFGNFQFSCTLFILNVGSIAPHKPKILPPSKTSVDLNVNLCIGECSSQSSLQLSGSLGSLQLPLEESIPGEGPGHTHHGEEPVQFSGEFTGNSPNTGSGCYRPRAGGKYQLCLDGSNCKNSRLQSS